MTERFKPGDKILADKASVDTEKSIVNDIYNLKAPSKDKASDAESSFTKKLAGIDDKAHKEGGLLENKPDLHVVGVFNGNLMLEHRNDGANFPHHRYVIDRTGEVIGQQTINEKTGKPEDVPNSKNGWLFIHEFKDGKFTEKADGTKEMRFENSSYIAENSDGSKTAMVMENSGRPEIQLFDRIHARTEEARELLDKENQNIATITGMLERKQELRTSCFESLAADLKSGHLQGESNDVTLLQRIDEQIRPLYEQLTYSKQKAELLQVTVETLEHQELLRDRQKPQADQLALQMLEKHNSQILKELSPDIWRQLGKPELDFSHGLRALTEVPPSDTGRPPAQILYTTSLDGKPPVSDVLDTKVLSPSAFRADALRAIDNDPIMMKIEQTASALNYNLNDVAQLARAGAGGTKGEDFVNFTRDKAQEIQKTLNSIEPALIVQAQREVAEMNHVLNSIADPTSKAELQKRIDAVNGIIDLSDPATKTRQDIDALTKFVLQRNFDPDTTLKWMQQELPAMVGSIVAAGAAVAFVTSTMGAGTPLVLSATASAAAGSAGWLAGGEVTKEALYQINSLRDIGVGSLNDRSKVGTWASTPEEKKDFVGQVLGPYTTQVAIDTTVALATMGVVVLSKVGGKRLLETMAHEPIATEEMAAVASNPSSQEFVVRCQQMEELAGKNPACSTFVNNWLKETKAMASFTVAQQGIEKAAGYFGEVNPQMSVGIALGMAITHGHLKSSDISLEKGGGLSCSPENIDHVELQLKRVGCQVERLPNGDLSVKYDSNVAAIIRKTGTTGEWQKLDEVPSPDCVQQTLRNWCTFACAEMLTGGKVTQRTLDREFSLIEKQQKTIDNERLAAENKELKRQAKKDGIEYVPKEPLTPFEFRRNAINVANTLTKLTGNRWEAFTPVDRQAAELKIVELQKNGKPWAAEISENPNSKEAHMVVVDKYDSASGLLTIRDPGKATTYKMELKNFLDHWAFENFTGLRELPPKN